MDVCTYIRVYVLMNVCIFIRSGVNMYESMYDYAYYCVRVYLHPCIMMISIRVRAIIHVHTCCMDSMGLGLSVCIAVCVLYAHTSEWTCVYMCLCRSTCPLFDCIGFVSMEEYIYKYLRIHENLQT